MGAYRQRIAHGTNQGACRIKQAGANLIDVDIGTFLTLVLIKFDFEFE